MGNRKAWLDDNERQLRVQVVQAAMNGGRFPCGSALRKRVMAEAQSLDLLSGGPDIPLMSSQFAWLFGVTSRRARAMIRDGRVACNFSGRSYAISKREAVRFASQPRPSGNPGWKKKGRTRSKSTAVK